MSTIIFFLFTDHFGVPVGQDENYEIVYHIILQNANFVIEHNMHTL